MKQAGRKRKRVEAAGGVVFDHKGRVAIVLQHNRELRLRWTLPKGKLEPGERPQQAALREVREETGFAVRVGTYLGAYDGRRRRVHYFRMMALRSAGSPDRETKAVRFVKPEVAARLFQSRRDLRMLDRAMKQQGAETLGAASRLAA